jgi:2-polyprenyl-6-methoxyphenol hydroxylase-like FAD-dependent oxidoreductase
MHDWRGRVIFGDELARFDGGGRFASVGLLRTDLIGRLARHVTGAIVTRAPLTMIRQSADAVVATFADGREAVGDVLVGADGLHSAVRAQFVASDPLVYAGYTVWRGIASMGFAEATGTTWMGPGKQFGLFPLKRERAYWFAARKANIGERDPPAGPRAAVAESFTGWPDPIPRVVHATEDAAILRTDIYDRAVLDRWSFGRVTLLGDAAHPAAPTLGQGACQAIEDAVVLGAVLEQTDDVAAGLQRYEAHRMRRANSFVVEARRIGKLGLWEGALACWLRDRMLGAMPAAMRERQLARMFDFALPPTIESRTACASDGLASRGRHV